MIPDETTRIGFAAGRSIPVAEIRIAERFWSKVDVSHESKCWNWRAGKDGNGYGGFGWYRRIEKSSRVAFRLRFGFWPKHACHRCDNPACCNPGHIYDGSPKENAADKVRRGRCNAIRGEQHKHAKLTVEKVILVREKYKAGGVSMVALAREFGCSPSIIQRTIRNETWRHV